MKNVETIVNAIDVELIQKVTKNLVEFDSQNPPGNCSQIAKYLEEEGKELGFNTQLYKMDNFKHNISLSFGKGEKDIVLCGHLDTVPVGDLSEWKYPPLEMTEKNGKLFGRGTADMKGGIATLIAVMDAIKQSNFELNHRIVFLGTADEEVGMYGAFHLKEKGLMENAVSLIITEATDLKVGIAEKGPFWLRIFVKGKAAHGSMPEQGVNAITGACKTIDALMEIIPSNENELLGKSTLNVGTIRGGLKINIVPEDCFFDCDFRLIPEINQEKFLKSIEVLLNKINVLHNISLKYEVLHSIPAICTDKNNSMVKKMLKWVEKIVNHKGSPIGLTYGTDAAALIPPKKIPFIIFGGGSPSVLHQANEFVELNDLHKAAKVITGSIIENYTSE